MESLSIIWEPAAKMAVMDTLEWYKNNGYGEQFARTFITNINDALSSIATSPGIGKFLKSSMLLNTESCQHIQSRLSYIM